MKALLIALGLTAAAATDTSRRLLLTRLPSRRTMPGIQRSVPAILRSGAPLWSTAILRSGAVLCSTAILPFAATTWSALLRLRLGRLPHVCRWVAYGYFGLRPT
jgi:hypothetical protein